MSDDQRKNRFAHLAASKQMNLMRAKEDARANQEFEDEDEDEVSDERSVESETESKPHGDEGGQNSLSRSFERLRCADQFQTSCHDGPTFVARQSSYESTYMTAKGYTCKSNTNNTKVISPKGIMKSGMPIKKDVNERLRQMVSKRQAGTAVSSPGSTIGDNMSSPSPTYMSEYNRFMDEMLDRCNRDTTLIKLVRCSDMEGLATYLQENSSSPRLTIEINTPNASHLTPLVIAIYQENYEAMQQLIMHGADPSKPVRMGNNSFHLVAESDNYGLCLCRLLEFASQRFSPKQISDMLNAQNIFNASPLDVLTLRMRSIRDHQHGEQIEQMISIMRSTIAKGNQAFHSAEQSCPSLSVI